MIAQYYVFIRNGKAGYKAIMENATATADWLQQSLEKTGRFVMLAPGGGKSLPLVAFKLKPGKVSFGRLVWVLGA